MKILRRFLTALLVVLATICVVNIYKISNQKNDTIGTLGNFDYYSDFDICTLETNPVFYYSEELGEYQFISNYNTAINFDGTNNQYSLLVNDKPCSVIKSTAGKLYGEYNLSFNDLENNEISNLILKIEYKFYVSHIELSITANLTEDQLKLLNEYFDANSCELRIIENVYYGGNEEELSKVYVNFFDNESNLIATYPTAYNSTLSIDFNELLDNVSDTETKYVVGWAEDGAVNAIDFTTYQFTKNVNLFAFYKDKKVVNYVVDSEILLTEYYKPGEIVSFNEELRYIKDGYSFNYWFCKEQANLPGETYNYLLGLNDPLYSEHNNSFEMLDFEDTTLNFVAGEQNSLTAVSFYNELNLVSTKYVGCLGLLELNIPSVTSSNSNFSFVGWTTDRESSTPIDLATLDFSQSEISLYACYKQSYQLIVYDPYDTSIKTVVGRFFQGEEITYDYLTGIVPEKQNYVLTFTNTTSGVILSKDGTQSFIFGAYHTSILPKYVFNGYTFSVEIPSLSFQKVKLIEIVDLADLQSYISDIDEIPNVTGKEYKGIYYGYSTASPRIDGVDFDIISTYGFETGKIYTLNLIYEDIMFNIYLTCESSDFYVMDYQTPVISFPWQVGYSQYFTLYNQRYGYIANVSVNGETFDLDYNTGKENIAVSDYAEDIYIIVTWTKK